MICRKATVALPDANFPSPWCQSLSSRAQNRGFCALLAFGTPVFSAFEHKIEVFVLFWPSGPPFSGVSSTKSGFLCAFGLRDRHFLAFRAQKRGFCALLPAGRAERTRQAERVERTGLAERAGELSSQKKRVAKVVTLLSFASLL